MALVRHRITPFPKFKGFQVSAPRTTNLAWLGLLGLAMVVASCSGEDVADSTTTSIVAERRTTTTAEIEEAPPPFRIGLFSGITTDNWWASLDSHQSDANDAFLGNGKTSLFTTSLPGFVFVPAAAGTDVPNKAVQESDAWVVEQPVREDMSWSDGEPLTANDLAFYFDVVREFDLPNEHAATFPPDVLSVTAPDAYTVRIEFASDPGLDVWETGIGLAPFVPSHFWGEHVEMARRTAADAIAGISSAEATQAIVDSSLADDNPENDIASEDVTDDDIASFRVDAGAAAGRNFLYGVSGVGEPSAGAAIVTEWQSGALGITMANANYFDNGTERTLYSDGSFRIANPERGEDRVFGGAGAGDVTVTYLDGPFVSEVHWIELDTRAAAYEKLYAGELDFVFDPSGVTKGLRAELATNPDLRFAVNQSEGFRYMAFNLRKPPMSDVAFRHAIATVINKEFVANDVLDGVVSPGYTIIHPELTASYNADLEKPGWVDGAPMGEATRYDRAIQILKDAGYTWATEPEVNGAPDGTLIDVMPGEGMVMPNGAAVPPLTLLSSEQEYDPYRATFATWIERWMNDLGIPVSSEPTDFQAIVEATFPPQTPETALAWDMYMLGWGGADPSLPGTSMRAFFHSDQDAVDFGGYNTPGYRSTEFDAAAEAFLAAETVDEAAALTREMEAIVARDLPYIVLFRTQLVEAHRRVVSFPVESIVGGHHLYPRVWASSVNVNE